MANFRIPQTVLSFFRKPLTCRCRSRWWRGLLRVLSPTAGALSAGLVTTLTRDMDVCVPYVFISYMHSPCDMVIHRPESCYMSTKPTYEHGKREATCRGDNSLLQDSDNGRHTCDYQVSGICPSSRYAKETEFEKTANRQNLTSTHDVSVHM